MVFIGHISITEIRIVLQRTPKKLIWSRSCFEVIISLFTVKVTNAQGKIKVFIHDHEFRM